MSGEISMERREFVSSVAGVMAGTALFNSAYATQDDPAVASPAFSLKYAPHFGMFNALSGNGLTDQLKFAHDQGFRAWEDNGMSGRPVKTQESIARTMSDLGMTMGVFVAEADFGRQTFTADDDAMGGKLVAKMKEAVEVAKRVNAKWCTVVPGKYGQRVPWDFQTARCIENLKRCAEVCEPHGVVMVLEPLNPRDHPGLFLTKVPQAYMLCEAVGSPSCKILNDLYHQQITEGNLIPNMDRAWNEIEYFQVGDNPGRREPTTGEIDYRNIFKHIHGKGFTGIVGMEHGMSKSGKDGVNALIRAYRECDEFRS